MVMEIVLPSCEIGKINICSLRNFLDLEYVIDFVPLCEEPGKLHVLAIAWTIIWLGCVSHFQIWNAVAGMDWLKTS